jgi:hypothetical protein
VLHPHDLGRAGPRRHARDSLELGEEDFLLEADVPPQAEVELGPAGARARGVAGGVEAERAIFDGLQAVVVPGQGFAHATERLAPRVPPRDLGAEATRSRLQRGPFELALPVRLKALQEPDGRVVVHDDEGFTRSEEVEGAEHGLAGVRSLELPGVDHAGGGKCSHRDLPPVPPHHDGAPGPAV